VTFAAGPTPGRAPAARLLALHLGLPLIAGALCVSGFSPFSFFLAPLLGLAVLFWVWRHSGSPRQAFLSGFVFGLGYFLAGVSWVFVSMHTFGDMPAVMAALATFAFCAYLALFPAAAGWLALRLVPGERPLSRAVACAAAFTLLEWIRGWLFTGFPWIAIGTSQVPLSPLAGFAPLFGTYGVTLAVALAAALCAMQVAFPRRWQSLAAIAAIFLSGAGLREVEWTAPSGPAIKVALVQGNVPQQLKWEESVRAATANAYRDTMIATDARVVILPEAAIPAYIDQMSAKYLQGLRDHSRAAGKDFLVGAPERVPPGRNDTGTRYYNSLLRLNADEAMPAFRKRHLVPFGEFVPWGFRWFVDAMRIPMGEFDRGAANQPPLVAGGVRFGVAICYEDIFGDEVIRQLPAAEAFVNVSNDAWFGESFAADQHLQASQMRALETGRWMVRATNTGASAAIDPKGRVRSRLPPFVAGTLVAEVTPMQGMTPYARIGDLPVVILAVGLLAFASRRRGKGFRAT
jgi:apolipoprotein N-acyltransferase